MTRINKLVFAAVLVAGVSLAVGTWAGYRVSFPVSVDNEDDYEAYGSLATARNSPDSTQRIGCSVYNWGTTEYGYCFARNAGGTSVSCSTTNASFLNLIKQLNGDSYLFFAWSPGPNPSAGACTYIQVANSSEYESKGH